MDTKESNHTFELVSGVSSSKAEDKKSRSLLELVQVGKSYPDTAGPNEILKNINLKVAPGEVLALLGASGSGKSTLLNLIGLIDTLDTGEMFLAGQNCSALTEDERSLMRKQHIGFIFQFHHLLADFTALENITLPALIAGVAPNEATSRGRELLLKVGLESKGTRYPNELSGGERQRCAVARSLINKPSLILADEPTGNLDTKLSIEVCELIMQLAQDCGSSAIIATHNPMLAAMIKNSLQVVDGVLLNS